MLTILEYESRHLARMRHLAERWRRRDAERPGLLPARARLPTGPLCEGARQEITEILNAVEQAELWSSLGAGLLYRPVRHLFSPEGRALIDLFVADERHHGAIFRSLRRALGLPVRPFSNAVFGITFDAVRAYLVAPLFAAESAQAYARGLLLLTLISEFLGDPVIHALTRRLDDLIEDPSTRALVGRYAALVDREERYHKAWPMIYRDLLVDDLRPEIIANHLKFFFLLIENNPTYVPYLGDTYPEYFVRILRHKLGVALGDADAGAVRARVETMRADYLRRKRSLGAVPAVLLEKRDMARWKADLAAGLRATASHGSLGSTGPV